jgi:hypothetical protein
MPEQSHWWLAAGVILIGAGFPFAINSTDGRRALRPTDAVNSDAVPAKPADGEECLRELPI